MNRGRFRIADIRATTVSIPLEAPLRHSNGAHWGRFVRTIVEVETEDGLIGLGELGGGGQSAEVAVRAMLPYLRGHDPFQLEAMRFSICNPTASLYNNRTQIHAAIEFACLDLIGRRLDVSVSDLLGGRVRDSVPFASYLFFRYADPATGGGEIRTSDQLVKHAAELRAAHGFTTHKLKGGVFPPDYEMACYRALHEAFPEDRLRYDPNAVLSVGESLRVARTVRDLSTEYLEDPTWGLGGMRQVRVAGVPLATNTVVVNPEQLAANVRDPAVDVVLLDTTFWGGIRACLKAAAVCETMQTEIAVHSSGELGIQLATMLHFGAVTPNLAYAADAHYHHLQDDVIAGGKMSYVDGEISVPDGPGLGVELDRNRLAEYAEAYDAMGSYPYDRDPGRPGWFALLPNSRFADPTDHRTPDLTPPS